MNTKREENKNVTFRRIGGRIVPIAIGSGMLYKGREKRVYQKGNVTIDRNGKRFTMRENGRKVGKSKVYSKKPNAVHLGDSGFTWVGINEKYQGKGYGRTLITESSRYLRNTGHRSMWNPLVGNRAATIKNKSDKFYVLNKNLFKKDKNGIPDLKVYNEIKARDFSNWDLEKETLFRKTNISGLKKKTKFSMNKRLLRNKIMLGAGIASIAYGVFKDGK